MLRFLSWWLLFEICNLKRLLGHGRETVLYLGFGANLSDEILLQRRIRPLDARYFSLRGHGLRFDHPAPWAGCGFASAEPAAEESLYGILYTLSARDAARMDFFEMVPIVRRYRRVWVEQDGERIYYYRTNRSTPGLKPSAEYLGYILDGLALHPDVDDEYRGALAAVGTREPGRLVDSYFGERPERSNGWMRRLDSVYQKMILRVFLRLLYPFSPSAFFIR